MRKGPTLRLIGSAAAILVLIAVIWAFTARPERVVKDSRTPLTLPKVATTSGKLLIDYYSDGMAGKQSNYSTDLVGQLVVDPDAYKLEPPQRGDVVWFKMPEIEHEADYTPPKQSAGRVIALAGERYSVRDSVIYINGKLLDTYYGRLLHWGQTEKEFLASSVDFNSCPKDCQATMKAFYHQTVPELTVPEGTVYVLADTSERGWGSNYFGPLKLDLVLGKVIGSTGQPKPITNG
ncbi:signal peptidase I [Paenibacillus rhizovicinus]|uniref:Signal peptidase I n=1 Tax=Paenibacillus rhizovicinus TaxID=2704463 RepID=A0A6C0NZF4_9BACL|nr:signal peptidase I [Paenibacillus rhizovicinus]QHW31625.1 signal peptidase I [Paenibacillus rhizovicinus]